jgi:hypothetical protein
MLRPDRVKHAGIILLNGSLPQAQARIAQRLQLIGKG